MKKNIKCFLQVPPQLNCASTALLILRLVMGAAFMMHGWGKMQNPMGWMPEQAPVHIPGIFQFLAAFSEFGGGLALILGLCTTLGAFGIFCTMAVAVFMHSMIFKDPFVNPTGGSSFELPAVYLVVSFVILMVGPGKFSLDKKIFGDRICE
jgi:putative oxidoreductase